MVPGSRSHPCTRTLTSCSISTPGIRNPAEVSARSFVKNEPETIVAVVRSFLAGMARRHPIAVAIKQHPGEEARLVRSSAASGPGGIAGELLLNGIPERLIDDRRGFARMELALVNALAAIGAVLQHQVERAP